jgi:oligopeptidase B
MHDHLFSPPLAKIAPTSFEQHGQRFVDPYAWLQDKSDPAVIAHLEAENAYAAELLRHTLPLQEQLFQEMRGRIQEDDASAPQRHGDFLYYTRVEAGRQYRLICRKRNAPGAAEEVLLDENALAAGNAYCNIFRVAPSPDHTLLAYTLDTTGALVYDLFVIDAASGALICGPIANVAWSAGLVCRWQRALLHHL